MDKSDKRIIIRAVVCIVVLAPLLYFVQEHIAVVLTIVGTMLACLVVIIYTYIVSKRHKPSVTPLARYTVKSTVASVPEREFYQLLVRACPKHTILQQVPLSSVIDKVQFNAFRSELFRVIDYCIVDKQSYAPLLLIELNDASHARADRVQRDQKVREICAQAGIELLVFVQRDEHTVASVKKAVQAVLKR